jgi:peptidyl-prolyl cis-trans isomerase B (cyclophilin B)
MFSTIRPEFAVISRTQNKLRPSGGPSVPNSKQRRDQARRHLERQLVRRQQRDVRRRKLNLIGTVVGVLVLFAVVIGTVLMLSHEDKSNTADPGASSNSPSASPSATGSPLPSRAPTPIAARAAKKTSGPCGYAEDATKLTAGNLFDVGLPPDPKPTPTGNSTAVFDTNQGTITVTLDGASAPCNVQSIKYLISKNFYDNTACPR